MYLPIFVKSLSKLSIHSSSATLGVNGGVILNLNVKKRNKKLGIINLYKYKIFLPIFFPIFGYRFL